MTFEKWFSHGIQKITVTFIQSDTILNLCSRMNASALCTNWQIAMTGGSSRDSGLKIMVVDCEKVNKSKSIHGSCGWTMRTTSWRNIFKGNWQILLWSFQINHDKNSRCKKCDSIKIERIDGWMKTICSSVKFFHAKSDLISFCDVWTVRNVERLWRHREQLQKFCVSNCHCSRNESNFTRWRNGHFVELFWTNDWRIW